MPPPRFIIVDTTIAPGGTRYLGSEDWSPRIRNAVPFTSREAATRRLNGIAFPSMRERCVVRRVLPAGARQADADNVATMRAELDGLRATDEAMAVRLADAIAGRDKAFESLASVEGDRDALADMLRDAREVANRAEASAAGWEAAYRTNAAREARVRAALGAAVDEPTDDAAARVVRERDALAAKVGELVRLLSPEVTATAAE